MQSRKIRFIFEQKSLCMRKAVILLSGGLDSATCLALAKQQGFSCHALSFDYGQRHASELAAAKRIAAFCSVAQHHIFQLDLAQFGGSALTDTQLQVPNYNDDDTIPITYVPARNTVFLSIALALAETIEAYDIFIGISAVDYSGYPDCRPEYIDAFRTMAQLATKSGVEGNALTIHTPLLGLSKAQTIQKGVALGMDYRISISCYRADINGLACGKCDSCVLRKQGFIEANIADATRYSKT